MIRIIFIVISVSFVACESEKIPYHCSIMGEHDGSFSDTIWDITGYGDGLILDHSSPAPEKDSTDIYDANQIDVSGSDILSDAKWTDIISGKPCTKIGISSECATDESCYPFIECGGICRKCGTSTAGSNCEIHSDCKCQMACLSLSDRKLTCYKICNDNTDCPAGQTCTDGWGEKYQHEYFKICKGINKTLEEGR